MGFKSFFRSVDHFLKRHFILILVIVFGGYWLLHDTVSFPEPRPFKEYSRSQHYSDEAVEEVAMMDSGMAAPRMMKNTRIAYAEGDGFDPSAEERKIIKNGNISIEAGDTEEAKTLAEDEIKNLEGSVSNMNSWQVRPGILGYNMTVRIPSGNLETLMTNLAKIGVKTSEGFNTSDITASYRDTDARIANLEARRDRLRQLLEFETESLSDVLQVDRELSQVQLEVEQLQKTQNRRDVDVAFSTLQLNIQPETQIGDVSNPYWSVENSWKKSVNDLIQSSQKIFDKLLKIVIFIPIWLPILLILWFLKRRFFR